MRTPITFLDDKVAVAPMPSEEDIGKLARIFSLAVVACTAEELDYDIEVWTRYGVEVVHLEVPDFTAPPLVSTYMAVKKILESRGKALVHCVGGKGRSGTIAATYLMHRYNMSYIEALKRVRQAVYGAVEVRAQEVFLYAYDRLRSLLRDKEVLGLWRIGTRYGWGRGEMHASYVTMLATRLFEQLRNSLGLENEHLKPLLVASLLHDVGLAVGEPHNEYSYGIILKSADLGVLDDYVRRVAALIALHHRREGDPRQDRRCRGIENLVTPLVSILKIADALDYSLRQVVEDVMVYGERDSLKLVLLCPLGCEEELARVEAKSWLLKELLRRRIRVETA